MNGQALGRAAVHSAEAAHLLRQGLHNQAEQCLKQAITLDPGNPQWHLELARLQRLHDPYLAKAAYEAAQSLGSPNAIFEASALYAEANSIEYLPPQALWHVDRLDIGAKLLFARDYLGASSVRMTDTFGLYRKHILQRTQGREPESLTKTSLADYERCFMALIDAIKAAGFKDEFAIPVDADGRILNGAHRLSAALALQLDRVPVVRIPYPWKGLEWGMAWFLNQAFMPAEINQLLQLWIHAHPEQTGLLIIEHDGTGVPNELMLELKQQFSMLAWRDLHTAVPQPPCFSGDGSPLPQGPWRYVLLDKNEHALHTFSDRQNEKHAPHLHCRAIVGDVCRTWSSSLLDEAIVSSWHPKCAHNPDNTSAIAAWTRYSLPSVSAC